MHSSNNVPARKSPSRDEINVPARFPSRDESQAHQHQHQNKGNRDNDKLSCVERVVTSAKHPPSCESVQQTQCNKVDRSQIFHVRHLEKVFTNVPRKLSRLDGDEIKDVEVNGMICGNPHVSDNEGSSSSRQDYEGNLCTTNNTDFKRVKTLFKNLAEFDPGSQKWNSWDLNDRWNTTP